MNHHHLGIKQKKVFSMSNFSNSSNYYRYYLEKGSKKHHCPKCNKKTFVFYIDAETNEYLPNDYGRCDRESKCSYHLNPYLDGYSDLILKEQQIVTGVTGITHQKQKYFYNHPKPQPTPKPIFFDFETFKQTLQPDRYEVNNFIQNLLHNVKHPFSIEAVTKVIQLYRLGTIANGYRKGAVTFPFIDSKNNIRAIQVKQFNKNNHTTGTDFLHSMLDKHYNRNNEPLPEWLKLYLAQEKRVSCLFGEHILSKYPDRPIALVEAPKTAIYGALYFQNSNVPIYKNCIWLAVYNKSSFSFDRLKHYKEGLFI